METSSGCIAGSGKSGLIHISLKQKNTAVTAHCGGNAGIIMLG